MAASVHVVEFGLSHGVIDIDARTKKSIFLFQLVKAVHSGGGLFRDTLEILGEFGEGVRIVGQGQVDHLVQLLFVLSGLIVHIEQRVVLFELAFSFKTLDQENSGVSSIIHDLVRSCSIRPSQSIEGETPVFGDGFTFPGEDLSGVFLDHSCGGLVLSGINVARAPADISAHAFKSLDENCGLDGHVERTHDTASLK